MPATVARHRCSPGRRHAYVGKNTIIRPDRRVTPATLAAADSLAAAPRTAGWCLQSQGSSSYNLLKHSGSVTTWRKAWESRKRARDAASWGRKNVVCGPKSAIARADRLGARPPPHLCRPGLAAESGSFPSSRGCSHRARAGSFAVSAEHTLAVSAEHALAVSAEHTLAVSAEHTLAVSAEHTLAPSPCNASRVRCLPRHRSGTTRTASRQHGRKRFQRLLFSLPRPRHGVVLRVLEAMPSPDQPRGDAPWRRLFRCVGIQDAAA